MRGRRHEADDLGLQALELCNLRLCIGHIRIGGGFHIPAEGGDSVGGQGVRPEVLPAALEGDALLIGEALESGDQASAGLMGLGQKADGRLIGRGFLGARIGQHVELTELRCGSHDRGPGVRGASERGDQTHAQRGRHGGEARATGFAATDDMGAFDMPDFVSNNTFDFVRVFGSNNGAGIEEYILAARHEGIKVHVADEIEIDSVHIQPRRFQKRI